MVRPSKCPGCKSQKSSHSFGKPGKNCTGPPSEDPASDHEDSVTSPLHEGTNDNVATLDSVLEAIRGLTAEVKGIKADNRNLRELFHSSSTASNAKSSEGLAQPEHTVTLPELRGMSDLVRKANRHTKSFGLGDDTDDESNASVSTKRESASCSKPGKLKSGKEAKPTSTVLYPQFWPHSFLCLSHAKRDLKYDDLSMAEFVAGYVQILQCKELSATELAERHKHLVSLMYLAQQFQWPAVLNFHGAVLLEIERGLLKWGDTFLHLESRFLYGSPRLTTSAPSTSATPTLFCRDYQKNVCSHPRDHYGLVKGVRKWVKHICATCWVQDRKLEYHREGSSDCSLHTPSTQSGNSQPSKN